MPTTPNHWNRVYNFSPGAGGEKHFELLGEGATAMKELTIRPEGLCGGTVAEAAAGASAAAPPSEEAYLDDYEEVCGRSPHPAPTHPAPDHSRGLGPRPRPRT